MYLTSRFVFTALLRSFRLHRCHAVLLFCLGLITCIHSLPANLQIDPVLKGASVYEIGPHDGPVKVDLRKPFNFNNNSVFTVWVHRDGFLSMAPPPPSLRGYPLNQTVTKLRSLHHKLISVFMARVGPEQLAKVRYRTVQRDDPLVSCRLRNAMSRLEQEIHVLFPLDRRFRIREMLVVNWEKLTFDKARRDETNTFEAVLITDEVDSFVVFNYLDMNWDRAREDPYPLMGMADGRADYALPLSGQPMANKVEESSNVATPGMWVVKTGKLRISGEFRSPDVKYALAEDKSRFHERLREIRDSLGFGEGNQDPCRYPITTPAPTPSRATSTLKAPLAQRPMTCADLQCNSNARCERVGDGACCVCNDGFIGDGSVCINEVLIINGTISVTIDGRRTTGLHRLQVTKSTGYVRYFGPQTPLVQLLVPLFTTPLWYGAPQEFKGVNAFQLSGLRMDRFANVDVGGIGNFRIVQKVGGRASDGSYKWVTEVAGRLSANADLPKGEKLKFEKDESLFEMTVNTRREGMIEIKKNVVLKSDTKTYLVSWQEEITYQPSCSYKKPPGKMSLYYKQLYCARPQPDEVFCLASAVVRGGTKESNPCSYPKMRCPGEKEICVLTANSYRCDCEKGYELRDQKCKDINECLTRRHECDRNAVCANTRGGYSCACKAGYTGDGKKCEPTDPCLNNRCDANAMCVRRASRSYPYSCQCKPGYGGDGFQCQPLKSDPCKKKPCSVNGVCFDFPPVAPYCACKDGFVGDGYKCEKKASLKCDEKCHHFATCVDGKCKCKAGLKGNGTNCFECGVQGGMDCRTIPNSRCTFDTDVNYYRCKCRKGYTGDPTVSCTKAGYCSLCDKNADCLGGYRCRCRPGYRDVKGDGRTCVKECARQCHDRATCGADGQCRCVTGYKGDGVQRCDYNCDLCHRNADCHPDRGCRCQQFYRGNGLVCELDHQCTTNDQCGRDRECKLHAKENAKVRLCTCRPGYVLKSGKCVLEYPCRREDVRCHVNAICIDEPSTYLPYTCQCKQGYSGDGLRCELVVRLAILPTSSFEVKEGDQVRFKCKILSGNIEPNKLEWSKKRSSIRNAVRINVDRERKLSELIILTARPEDSGHYVCEGGNVKVNAFLTVKRNLCNRKCHDSAFCDVNTRQCTCYAGFRGDGTTSCIREVCSNFPSLCGRNAVCKRDVCVCKKNYIMKGKICERIPDCRTTVKCHVDARCVNRNGNYECRCNNGYIGDGKKCTKIKLGCNLLQTCVQNAECVHVKVLNQYVCRCMKGYFGNGEKKCQKRYDCTKKPNPCGENAVCEMQYQFDDRSRTKVHVGVCKCKDGFKMVADRCYKDVDLKTSLFLSQGSIIYRIPIVRTDKISTIWYSTTVTRGSPLVVALATDCNERRVYWSNSMVPYVYSAKADRVRDKKVLANNLESVEGLAVDWIAGNVFYTQPEISAQKPAVGVMTKNGTHRRIIAKKNVTRPRAIAVDPMNGKVYWTDWDRRNPRIESANMDGTERKIVVEKLSNLPNGLVFDFGSNRLCWATANKNTGRVNTTGIYCIRPGVEVSPTPVFFANNGLPFSLTYNSPTFYFTDWESKRLQSVTNGVRKEINFSLRTTSSKLYGVTVMPPRCPAGQNGCSRTDNNYGGCKYLCLPVPGRGRVCACPDNLPRCNPTV